MSKIIIYSDGGCRGNGKSENIGAYAAVIKYGSHIKELKKAEKNTTNNIQELKGVINALKQLNKFDIPVEVITDSIYVCNGINNWIYGWLKKGWKTSTKKPVENKELWLELYELKKKFKDIQFIHCNGHDGVEGNERADKLVNEAMDKYLEGDM